MGVVAAHDGRRVGARLAVCGLVAWLWLWLAVDPSRLYHGANLTGLPAFSIDLMYQRAHGQYPGGLLAYACAWLAQLWVQPALAAAILALAAVLAAATADLALAALAGRRLPGWRYVPLLACLLADGHYLYLLDWQLGWALAWAATAMALRRPEARPAVRAAVLLPGLMLLYGLLGGPALVAVPLLCLGECRRSATRPLAAALLTAPLWMPALVRLVWFDDPLALVYAALLPGRLPIDSAGLAQLAALAMLGLGLVAGGLAMRPPKPTDPRPAMAWLAPLLVSAALLGVGRDIVAGRSLELTERAAKADWPGLLAVGDRIARRDLTQYDAYNLLMALAHTGMVGDRLLALGLTPLSTLRDRPELTAGGSEVIMRAQCGLILGDLNLRLGLVNDAEHELHETLETQGTYPALLVPMARIQALKDRPRAARVLLRLAAAQPGDPAGARPLQARAATDPNLAGDALQRQLAAARLQADRYDLGQLEPLLEAVTREHPEHRLAQEYLLALYLFGHRLDKLAASLATLIDPARTSLPRHVEEALICWELLHGRPADTGRWAISAAARQRFEDLSRAMGCSRDRMVDVLYAPQRIPRCALAVRDTAFADTYYHYRMFGRSGADR